MKYRIKIYTFLDGTKSYAPQVKTGFMSWKYIDIYGFEFSYIKTDCSSREMALDFIDNHYNSMPKTTIKYVEIEYITN